MSSKQDYKRDFSIDVNQTSKKNKKSEESIVFSNETFNTPM